MLIKKEYLDAQSTLADLINTLKSFEMDITKREMNQTIPKVAPSTAMKNLALMTPIGDMGSSSGKTVSYSDKAAKTLNPQLTKLANEHVELFNAFMTSFEALKTGDLKSEMMNPEDMYQLTQMIWKKWT